MTSVPATRGAVLPRSVSVGSDCSTVQSVAPLVDREAAQPAVDGAHGDDARADGRRREHFAADRLAPTLVASRGVEHEQLAVGRAEREQAVAEAGAGRQRQAPS